MKALSIKQPYATLICCGVKDVENRSWNTNYRGTVLIHASLSCTDLFDKRLPLDLFREYDKMVSASGKIKKRKGEILEIKDDKLCIVNEDYRKEFMLLKTEIAKQSDENLTLFCEQAIIGRVDIVDCLPAENKTRGRWSAGSGYHWILENPVLYGNPVENVKGSLRFWSFDGTIDIEPAEFIGK